MTVKVCIITGFGINSDKELAQAFELSGATADRVHINDLISNPDSIQQYHIIGFPGGFSFGDHIGSGKVFAHLFQKNLQKELEAFVQSGKLIIGICNGFQVLVKMGVLPNTKGDWTPETSLIHNDHGLFEDSWVKVEYNQESPCVWTKDLTEMDLPIRHGEGRFIAADQATLNMLSEKNLVALRYKDRNPNGSEDRIAGITDPSGRILGLMPHPEAFITPQNHPLWRRGEGKTDIGLKIIQNGVDFIKSSDILK